VPVTAILTAAGSGSRLGRALPKALVRVGGVPLVVRAASGLAASGVVGHIVVTVPAEHQAAFATELTHAGPALHDVPVTLVVGGPTRQSSVAAGLRAVAGDVDVVLVHDAARALTPPGLVAAVVAAVRGGHASVVPAVPLTDSVVEVLGDGVRPVDRSRLRAVQTPQGFDRALLDRAHQAASAVAGDESAAATDDASLCATIGQQPHVIAGSDEAFKITTPRDLAVAELIVQAREAGAATEPTEPVEPTERVDTAVPARSDL
jgi:2-C-methyl-D-erythritol 4-phosphate cytidylyltransferase